MRNLRIILSALLVAVSAPWSASADHQFGSLTGTVRNEAGEPLGNICVNASGPRWMQAMTDDDGTFSMEFIFAGEYLVGFRDCAEPRRYMSEWFEDASAPEEADVVVVTAGGTTSISAALALGGAIEGRVTTDSGAGIGGLCVSGEDGSDWTYAYTDATGAYRLGGFGTGAYRVFFGCEFVYFTPIGSLGHSNPVDPRDYVPEWFADADSYEHATPVPVTQGVATGPIDAALSFGGSISGLIEDASGEPLSDVCATAVETGGGPARWAVGYGGAYRIGGLQSGTYKVEFADCAWPQRYASEWFDDARSVHRARPLEVTLGSAVTAIDAVLAQRPTPDVAITGLRVRDVPLSTSVTTLPGPGTLRDVDVDVANLGSAASWGTYLSVWVEMANGDRHTIGGDELHGMQPGERVSRSFRWDGLGSIGDAEVQACITTYDDSNERNNYASVRHHVLVGGTGQGMSLRPGYGYCGTLSID